MRQSKLIYYSPPAPALVAVKTAPMRNIALVYDGKILRVAVCRIRREKILHMISWRKLYGPKFRQCEVVVNFND